MRYGDVTIEKVLERLHKEIRNLICRKGFHNQGELFFLIELRKITSKWKFWKKDEYVCHLHVRTKEDTYRDHADLSKCFTDTRVPLNDELIKDISHYVTFREAKGVTKGIFSFRIAEEISDGKTLLLKMQYDYDLDMKGLEYLNRVGISKEDDLQRYIREQILFNSLEVSLPFSISFDKKDIECPGIYDIAAIDLPDWQHLEVVVRSNGKLCATKHVCIKKDIDVREFPFADKLVFCNFEAVREKEIQYPIIYNVRKLTEVGELP